MFSVNFNLSWRWEKVKVVCQEWKEHFVKVEYVTLKWKNKKRKKEKKKKRERCCELRNVVRVNYLLSGASQKRKMSSTELTYYILDHNHPDFI